MATDSTKELNMDADNLYREEIFSDQKAGTIRRLTPVTAAGDDDSARQVIFVGQAQVMTPMGTLPISFEIEAATLVEAAAGYGKAAQEAVDRTAKELEEMRRQAASQIVVPKGSGGGLGALPGGVPGGGKIQMP